MWSAQRAGTPRGGIASANSESGMQRFRSQGATTAVPARRLSSPAMSSKARSSSALLPSPTPAASSSSPAPSRGPSLGRGLQPSPSKRPPSGGRQAQQDLTQKLRAMDLALERIESEDFMKKHHKSLVEETHSETSGSCKENLDPSVLGHSWEVGLHNAAAGLDTDGCQSSTRGRLASPSRTSVVPLDHPSESRYHTLHPKAEAVDPHRVEALEAKWNEAHGALRSELDRGLESLREGREEQHNSTVRLLTEFEVELTAAIEARMKEADSLMERRLIEAGEGMQRRLTEFVASVEEREKVVSHEGDSKERLDEMEACLKTEKARLSEQSESLESAKEQLTTCRQTIHQLQEEYKDAKEHLATCKQRVQQVQEEREDTKEQLLTLRQRIVGLDSCVSKPSSSEIELRRIVSEMENRLQRFEDGLAARFQESECRIRSSTSDEITSLRQRVQPLLDTLTERAICGANGSCLSAEAERRLQHLDESCSARICESEGRLLAQQRALEGQAHDNRHELQRHIGDLEHRLLSELRMLEARSTSGRLEDRFEDLLRSSESDLATLRERLDSLEIRCVEEAREVFRHDIEESEARCMGAVEVGISAQFDALRAEFRSEVWPQSSHHESFEHSEEERRALSGQLEALADRQKRQQHLIEDLLSAAARRPSAFDDGSQLGTRGGSAASALSSPAQTQAFIEALTTRLTSVEDRIRDQAVSGSGGLVARIVAVEDRLAGLRREAGSSSILSRSEVGNGSVAVAAVELAERCSGRLDLLSARVASVEDRLSVSGAPAAASVVEVQEALRAWPPKLEELAARLDTGNDELRRELTKEFQEGLERWQAEGVQQRAEVEDLKAALQKANEESGKHRAEVEELMAWTTESISSERKLQADEFAMQVSKVSNAEQTAAVAESMAAVAVEQARGMRQIAEKAEQSYSKTVAGFELDRAKSQARSESESREFATMVRLEARLEGAEARQILAFTELSERLEEDLKRDGHRSAADVDLRRNPAFRCNNSSTGAEEQAHWFKALRNLERHLKDLMAAQAEDSAEALRSMAQMVEEHSVLRGDVSSLRGDTTMIGHSGIMDNTKLLRGDSSMLRSIGDRSEL